MAITEKELLQIIRQAKEEGKTELVLSSLGIKILPPEIGELKNLQGLWLYDNKLTTLPPEIGELKNLQQLWLNYNQLTTLPAEIGELKNLKDLWLYNNKLMTLPPEIGELKNLQILSLNDNKLTILPPEICELKNLQILDISQNKLTILPAECSELENLTYLYLNNNQLKTLPVEFGELENLTSVRFNDNQLTTLPPEIGELKNLKELFLYNNQLTTLPPEICKLKNLQELWLQNNQLMSLPAEIGELENLETLYLYNNRLTALPPEIGELKNLQILWLSKNRLTTLPTKIGELKNLKELYLHGNNDLGIPPEILGSARDEVRDKQAKPAKPSDILSYYFRTRTEPSHRLNEAKVILVGQGAVGKTSLLNRLIDNTYNPHETKTEGIEIRRWSVKADGEEIALNVWDFGGQEIMHATHQFFLTKRSLYLLILDSRNDRKANKVDYWLRLIESFAADSPVIIVCNKCDEQPMDLDWTGLQRKFPQIKGFVKQVSCQNNIGIDEVHRRIRHEVADLDHISDKLPETWFQVKESLEQKKGKEEVDYLPLQKYIDLCWEKGVKDKEDQDRLLGFMNDLGVMLYYGTHSIMTDLNILNPEWVTNGVYSIINNKELLEKRDGILNIGEIENILDSKRYPKERFPFILSMMKKFEICFEFEGSRGQKFLIPSLLSEQEKLTGDWENSLRFEYHYEILMGSIIKRFIVRMHPYIYEHTYWKNGVVLISEDGMNQALVRSDEEERTITIIINGQETGRRQFLEIIRADFRKIHASLSGLVVDERIPIPGHPEIRPISYKHLLKLEIKGTLDFLPEGADVEVSVRVLLDGIETKEKRQERREEMEKSEMGKERLIHIGKVDKMYISDRDMYIAGGDININFGNVNTREDFVAELEKLKGVLAKTVAKGEINKDTGTEVDSSLNEAVAESKKPKPDKSKLLDYIDRTMEVLSNAAGTSTAVTTAISILGEVGTAISRLFG